MNPRTTRPIYKNMVLASLPKAEIARLQPHLSPVTLELRQQLLDGAGASHVYFLEEGLASVVLSMENGTTVEVGVIGKERWSCGSSHAARRQPDAWRDIHSG